MTGNINMNGYTLLNYSGGGGSLTSDTLSINSGGYNYLTKNSTTVNSVVIYGMNSNSFMFQNNQGENAGCGANGASDDFTIWTAGDGGTHLNIQDEDSNNSRVAYVNSSGNFITVSSKKYKHSIIKKKKDNYDYLNRLNKINVYSYAYNYKINDDDDDKKKIRKYFKNKRHYTGLILEEIENNFDNCIDKFKYFNENENNKEELNLLNNNYKPDINEDEYINNKNNNINYNGINYNSLLCYTILALQDLNKKFEDENKLLKNKINIMEDKFNILMNKLNITI
jgi:hypothetical protein